MTRYESRLVTRDALVVEKFNNHAGDSIEEHCRWTVANWMFQFGSLTGNFPVEIWRREKKSKFVPLKLADNGLAGKRFIDTFHIQTGNTFGHRTRLVQRVKEPSARNKCVD